MVEHSSICLNCKTPLHGRFCYACGQKVIEPNERTVLHFIYQFFGSAFFLENNFFKNLWNLIAYPGKLPLDFIEGRRKRWMPPFSLFLLINLFYFWFSPLSDFNLKLNEQMHQPFHKELANYLITKKISSEGITLEEYAKRYNEKSTDYSNSLVILQVPIFAIFLFALYWRKQYYFADHFIIALYFFSFVLLGALIQSALLYSLLYLRLAPGMIWQITNTLYGIAIVVYSYFMLRRAYQHPYWKVLLAIIPVLFLFLVTHFIYRTLLFLIIYSVT